LPDGIKAFQIFPSPCQFAVEIHLLKLADVMKELTVTTLVTK
jgi:hypothetical protein